jgi:replicative DNA helicase
MTPRDLPHSENVEQYILSCAFGFPETIQQILGSLTGQEFYTPRNRFFLQAIAWLDKQGLPVDFHHLDKALKQTDSPEKTGGVAYIMEISAIDAQPVNLPVYISEVKDLAHRRGLYSTLTRMAGQALDGGSAEDTIAATYQELEKIGAVTGSNSPLLTLADMAKMYETHVSNLDQNRFKTGFEELDAVIKGVSPGETLFISAYSGLFKSALLQNLLLGGCERSGLHHIFYSLEMPATRVFERTVQISLGRFTYNVESEFHHHNRDNRGSTMLDLAGKNANKLLVCETPGLGLDKIEHYTRLARSKYGVIGAIGIDYMGLMSATGTKSEYERISAVAEGSKHLAKRLGVPVIVLTQINRLGAGAADVEMWNVKGSGAVEASADYLLMMTKGKSGEMEMKVAKNRNGEAGARFNCQISKQFLRFDNITTANDLAEIDANRGKQRAKKSNMDWTTNGPDFD